MAAPPRKATMTTSTALQIMTRNYKNSDYAVFGHNRNIVNALRLNCPSYLTKIMTKYYHATDEFEDVTGISLTNSSQSAIIDPNKNGNNKVKLKLRNNYKLESMMTHPGKIMANWRFMILQDSRHVLKLGIHLVTGDGDIILQKHESNELWYGNDECEFQLNAKLVIHEKVHGKMERKASITMDWIDTDVANASDEYLKQYTSSMYEKQVRLDLDDKKQSNSSYWKIFIEIEPNTTDVAEAHLISHTIDFDP